MSTHRKVCVLLAAFSLVLMVGAASVRAQNDGVLESDAEANEDDQVIVYPDGEDTADDQPAEESGEALERRAGEQTGEDPHGRAAVLGMYIQEADGERVKVIDVAAASPAFDAGIRKGDVISSFDGFRAESYRKWVDGIRSLVNDAPEGDTMPIVLEREGKAIHLRLRKPMAQADEIVRDSQRPPYQQVIEPSQPQQPLQPPQQVPQDRAGAAYGGVGVGGFGSVASGDQSNASTDRAVAEIFRLSATAQSGQPFDQINVGLPDGRNVDRGIQSARPTNAAPGTATGSSVEGQQIGMASLTNSSTGMSVTIDVGGLSPGSYLVGIDNAGATGMGANMGAPDQRSTVEQRQSELRTRQTVPRNQPQPPRVGPNRGSNPSRQQPGTREGGGGGRQPQSEHRPLGDIPPTVLAQVLRVAQNQPAAGAAGAAANPATPQGPATPSTAQATPANQPGADPRIPQNATPRNQNDLRRQRPGQTGRRFDARSVPQDISAQNPANVNDQIGGMGSGAGTGPLITIGTLTVDDSGAGRMQQTVEGVQVQHVVGQAIVIYSQQVPASSRVQPTPEIGSVPRDSGQPGVIERVGDPRTSQQNRDAQRAAGQQTPVINQTNGSSTPIAAGTIRLVTDQTSTNSKGVGTNPAANLPDSGHELR